MGKTVEVNIFASITALIILIFSCIQGGMLIQKTQDDKKTIELLTQVEETSKLQQESYKRITRLLKTTRMDYELCQEQLNQFQAREMKGE